MKKIYVDEKNCVVVFKFSGLYWLASSLKTKCIRCKKELFNGILRS